MGRAVPKAVSPREHVARVAQGLTSRLRIEPAEVAVLLNRKLEVQPDLVRRVVPMPVLETAVPADFWLSRHRCGQVSCDPEGVSFVWQVKGDRAAGEQDQRERGLGAVEAGGRAGDEATLLSASVRPWLIPGPIAARIPSRCLRDRLGEPDERLQPAASEPRSGR